MSSCSPAPSHALNTQRAHPMRVIAITGSNGKSTVTAMCGDMCRMAGLATCVAGNIGLPVLDALYEIEQGNATAPEVWVLELSSFQLETTKSLNADAATVLNLSEDHMDRYPDMAAYAAAKARIFSGNGVQVLNRDDARTLAMALPGRRVVSFGLDRSPQGENFGLCEDELCLDGEMLMPLSALPVAGLHNAANALAALALTRALGLPMAALLRGLMHFKGLPHRVEKVAEIGGVTYYDDSKGTNVGATEAALYGMGKRKAVVILGGDGKGQDFSPLKAAVEANARAVLLIGRDAPLIEAAIAGSGVEMRRCSQPAGRRRAGAAPRPARRCGAAVARLRQLRHVPQLRPPRRSLRRGGEPAGTERSALPSERGNASRAQGDLTMLYTARAPKPSGELDFSLLWLALGLLAIGLVMVYSASLAIAEAARYTGGNGEYYLLRQGLFIGIGVGVGAAAFQVPMRVWQQARPICSSPACSCWWWC
jgi:UDP-N-acetylmuramoylalanine--D-glutamate ligase